MDDRELRVLFGKRLKQIRLEKGLTQEQLAEDTSVSTDMIGNIERGVNAPSFKTLAKLTLALNVKLNDLFTFHKTASDR